MSFISESSTPSKDKYPSLTDLRDPTLPAAYHIEDNVPYHWGSSQDQMDMMLPMDQYYVRQGPAQPYAGNEQHRQRELEVSSAQDRAGNEQHRQIEQDADSDDQPANDDPHWPMVLRLTRPVIDVDNEQLELLADLLSAFHGADSHHIAREALHLISEQLRELGLMLYTNTRLTMLELADRARFRN